MIYILVGENIKSKNIFIKKLIVERESFFVSSDASKELIMSYCYNVDLFNKTPVLVIDNVLNNGEIIFNIDELATLKNSGTDFIFTEDKLLKSHQDKYKKHGEINFFEGEKIIQKKFDIFSLTNAFEKRDKISAWVLYHKALSEGVEPEAIAGVLFWKIKTMILSSSRIFDKNELKIQSSNIINLYHKAHRGEEDFLVGLEQFILSSLSSKQTRV